MNEADFKSSYIAQFLASHMAQRYAADYASGHVGEPYNRQPIKDAEFLADCAWDQIKAHAVNSKSVAFNCMFKF